MSFLCYITIVLVTWPKVLTGSDSLGLTKRDGGGLQLVALQTILAPPRRTSLGPSEVGALWIQEIHTRRTESFLLAVVETVVVAVDVVGAPLVVDDAPVVEAAVDDPAVVEEVAEDDDAVVEAVEAVEDAEEEDTEEEVDADEEDAEEDATVEDIVEEPAVDDCAVEEGGRVDAVEEAEEESVEEAVLETEDDPVLLKVPVDEIGLEEALLDPEVERGVVVEGLVVVVEGLADEDAKEVVSGVEILEEAVSEVEMLEEAVSDVEMLEEAVSEVEAGPVVEDSVDVEANTEEDAEDEGPVEAGSA